MLRVLVLLWIAMAALLPQRAVALPPVSAMMAERSLGSDQAKVTIIEYSSLTCPHCAEFHKDTLPQIKAQYIDAGLVRYVQRDFPLDGRALAAAMIARCAPPERYFGLIDVLFRDQTSWTRSADPIADLKVRAQLAGMSAADVDACLSNQDLLKAIQERALEAQNTQDIKSTPIFFIGKEKVSGAQPFSAFQAAIDKVLAAAK